MNMLFTDKIIIAFDHGLRTLSTQARSAQRENPAERCPQEALSAQQAQAAGRLMRVNHAGEIAAQGLYYGQSLTAQDSAIQAQMQRSASEEEDHLAWCEQRLRELNTAPSLVAPLWYFGACAMGAAAGLCGDKWSLGFIAETEHQVAQHLQTHLKQLPANDIKSRAIINKMQADERRHGEKARQLGGKPLPRAVQAGMKLAAKVMTTTAHWL